MNRREFFAAMAGAGGALVLPYEPKRIYSFPSERIWVTDTIDQALGFILENTKIVFTREAADEYTAFVKSAFIERMRTLPTRVLVP